jgi:hypothetical protein
MQTIVLLTRENSERATHVSVYLCSNYSEAKHFCNFVNHLPLTGEDRLFARMIIANAEHSLGKHRPFCFDDFVKVDGRTIQLLFREFDDTTLAIALKEAKEETKDFFLRNMSKRAADILEIDMEYMGPVAESDIESARQLILDIYNGLPPKENRFDKAWAGYKSLQEDNPKNQAEPDSRNQKESDDRDHIVLVFCGAETAADCVSVYLFDKYDSADNFCNYLNNLKPYKGSFFYARHAEQMVEYETTKPLLASFDQIFKYIRSHDDRSGTFIIRDAFKKLNSRTILAAFKGIDKRSRMLIMQSLPTKTTDAINKIIENSDNDYGDLFSLNESRRAQEKIINAVNKVVDKLKKEEESSTVAAS